MALNNSREDAIYRAILEYRRFPTNIISGSPERMELLERLMQMSTTTR
jgi:hypothetical protein